MHAHIFAQLLNFRAASPARGIIAVTVLAITYLATKIRAAFRR